MRLLILSYYGLRESLLGAAEALKKLDITVFDFPVCAYVWTPESRNTDLQMLVRHIETTQPEVILFWSLRMDRQSIHELRHHYPKILMMLFNWDDPYAWYVPESELKEKAKYFDIALTSCSEACQWYQQQGVKKALFLLPGFDPNQFVPVKDSEYVCDVSLCATNLYTDPHRYPDQLIRRHELVEAFTQQSKFTFRLYGPSEFQKLYPHHYGGWVNYFDLTRVFSTSRINLCTHICGQWKYANERCILIAGSRGLLLVDPVAGFETIFDPTTECIFLDLKDPVGQIQHILANYDKYTTHRDTIYQRAFNNYTWDHWARTVKSTIDEVITPQPTSD
jgi:spore maturation protein CgeB